MKTDESGREAFVDQTSKGDSFLHKTLRVKEFGIYCNESGEENWEEGGHCYIIAPLSFKCTLRQSDAQRCVDFPKYLVSSKLSRVHHVNAKATGINK